MLKLNDRRVTVTEQPKVVVEKGGWWLWRREAVLLHFMANVCKKSPDILIEKSLILIEHCIPLSH